MSEKKIISKTGPIGNAFGVLAVVVVVVVVVVVIEIMVPSGL
jgi:hypothetical protein